MENDVKKGAALELPFLPEAPESRPEDLLVIPEMVVGTGARLRLYPKPAAMDRVLDDSANGRWKTSRYMIGRTLYCKLSIWDGENGIWVERDAPNCGEYSANASAEKAEEAGSQYNAMLHFGFWRDISAMPAMAFGADRVHIVPVGPVGGKPAGYRLAAKMSVESLERAESGQIVGVTLRDTNGGTVEWHR